MCWVSMTSGLACSFVFRLLHVWRIFNNWIYSSLRLYLITGYILVCVKTYHLEWLLFWINIESRKPVMDGYGTHGLVQTVRETFFGISWSTVFGVLIFICITTRIVSGLQSGRKQDSSKPQTVRLAPYWFPWIGHGPAFLWNHVSFFKRTRFVLPEHFVLCSC